MPTKRRSKNFRRAVVPAMRDAKGHIEIMIRRWKDAPSTTWYDAGDGKGATYHRPGRTRAEIPASEYPENDPVKLQALIKYLSSARDMLNTIIKAAEQRLATLEARS